MRKVCSAKRPETSFAKSVNVCVCILHECVSLSLVLLCDALQGLKFLSFPYILTLQLKRFDFDYVTMHRIKLNDRCVWLQQAIHRTL